MRKLWSEENKFQTWLRVEIAVLEARAELGDAPEEAADLLCAYALVNVERIEEIEAEHHHDMIAFIEQVRESLAETEAAPYADQLHRRITSYDVEDPATILLLREAVTLVLEELGTLWNALLVLAHEHKDTLMIARTHGQYARPDTFGRLLLVYASLIERSIERLRTTAGRELREGKISGAVGNYAGLDPCIERLALQRLDLSVAPAETQILQRDRHAAVMAELSIVCASIEQIARTFWTMMHANSGELEESFGKNQRGSSAMPQKRNPIKTEQLFGLPRVVRGLLQAVLENVATLECREISQSSVEREAFPTITALTHYMAARMTKIVQGMTVNTDRMRENFDHAYETWAAEDLREALVAKGISDERAYTYAKRIAKEAVDGRIRMSALAVMPAVELGNEVLRDVVGNDTFTRLFNPMGLIRPGVDLVFSRFPAK